MIVKHKIPSYSITWLANTYNKTSSKGIIENYYTPETIDEYIDLCRALYNTHEEFRIIGHTSNIYILPNTSIKNIVNTRKLSAWHETETEIICECGVSVKRLSSEMIGKGINGFAELVDLPGTVGAALYGNSGVGDCLLSNILVSVDILQDNGVIRTYTQDAMNFRFRSSILKNKMLGGAIISATFKKVYGDIECIKKRAQYVHNWRKENQPGPAKNLGTTVLIETSQSTFYGVFIRIVSKLIYSLMCKVSKIRKLDITLTLTGTSELKPYLFGLNRYMWQDEKAHMCFDKYINVINRLYKKPLLEIEVW